MKLYALLCLSVSLFAAQDVAFKPSKPISDTSTLTSQESFEKKAISKMIGDIYLLKYEQSAANERFDALEKSLSEIEKALAGLSISSNDMNLTDKTNNVANKTVVVKRSVVNTAEKHLDKNIFYKINVPVAIVRTEPSLKSPIKRRLLFGDVIEANKSASKSMWVNIKNGGYIYKTLLKGIDE